MGPRWSPSLNPAAHLDALLMIEIRESAERIDNLIDNESTTKRGPEPRHVPRSVGSERTRAATAAADSITCA